MSAGVESSVAISAVIVYRAFTFALPIATGSLIYLVWRRKPDRHNEVKPEDDGTTDSLLHAA
jgi:uncharacterized membrane protein YbhN (UPF0104 family)